MTEADFHREATQLFQEMGLDLPPDTLDFFEKDSAEKTNWKSGLKVPSPPRARRTNSSGTTHTQKRQQQGIERHRNSSSSLKRPSTHERSPPPIRKTSSVKEHSKRSEASERFGYKGPQAVPVRRAEQNVSNHLTGETRREPDMNAASGGDKPKTRPIHRIPAPKTTNKRISNTNSAVVSSSNAFPADPVSSQTSSLKISAVVSASQPAVQNANPSTQNGFHATPYNQVDGNLLSRSTVPSSNGHTELQRRRSSPEKLPDNSASNDPQSSTQVIYSRKPSFQLLSLTNSSQRIMHTKHDGGSSKRHHSIDQAARPLLQSRIPAPPKLHNEKKTYAGSSARKRVPLFTQSPPLQEGSNSNALYDRLSAPTSPADEKPPPLPQKHNTHVPQPQQSKQQLHQGGQQIKRDVSNVSQVSGIYDRLSPLEIAEITKAAAEENVESKDNGKTQHRSVSRQPSSASNISSSSETTSEQDRRVSNHLKTKGHHRRHSTEGGGSVGSLRRHSPDNSSHSLKVQSHSRRRSDENTHLVSRTGSSTSSSRSSNSRDPRSPERSTETSDLERNITSPSSISTLSSPEPPRPDTQTPDSDERRARLDINWSKQSLDRNMSAVASSTVAALSSLVEVVSTPVKTDRGFQYNNSMANGGGVPPWYADLDESESTDSSVPMSPVSSPVPAPNPSGQTGLVSSGATQMSLQSSMTTNPNGSQTLALKSNYRSPRTSTGELASTSRKSNNTENSITMNGFASSSDAMNGRVVGSASKTSLTSQGSQASQGSHSSQDSQKRKSRVVGPPLHDYAIIEPPDHDYAVLDPEADRDFFGELYTNTCNNMLHYKFKLSHSLCHFKHCSKYIKWVCFSPVVNVNSQMPLFVLVCMPREPLTIPS